MNPPPGPQQPGEEAYAGSHQEGNEDGNAFDARNG